MCTDTNTHTCEQQLNKFEKKARLCLYLSLVSGGRDREIQGTEPVSKTESRVVEEDS